MDESKVYTNPSAKVKIKIIPAKCISAGICVIKAPHTYDLDATGMVYAKEGTWDEAADIIEGAKACPTTAILIEDMQGNQLYPEKN